MSTIILTGGGTAGHCLPNIALLPNLKNHFDKIYYVGSKTGIEKNIALKNNLKYYEISTAKLKRKITFSNLKIPIELVKGINQAKKIIKETSPNVIFSKGGYVSIPMVIAGFMCKIPVITHESDLTVGLANKIASNFSKKVLTSFPETASKVKKGLYVGPPIRQEIFNVNKDSSYQFFGFNKDKPVLLVTGGSQGAKTINLAITNILPKLLKMFNVIHLCGKGNVSPIKEKGYYQAEFLNEIEKAFAITNVCVTRAGSNTLFELLSLKIPCLVIPLPKNESRGDQILNARYFNEKKVVNLLYQEDITDNRVYEEILKTHREKELLMSNLNGLKIKSSNEKICEVLLNFSK